jgi:Tfp pilus assembly protein PilV
MPTTSPIRRSRHQAFTLAEALIASVVLSVAVLGISGVLVGATANARRMSDYSGAQLLARSLMEEIVAKPFTQPQNSSNSGCRDGNQDRSTYDNIADYDGYQDSTDPTTATTRATTLGGTTIDLGDTGTFTRKVSFEYRNSPGGPAVAGGTGNFGLITVTVSSSSGDTVTLYRLVSNVSLSRVNQQ